MGNKSAVIPLLGRGFTSKSPTVTAQLLTNMYREPQKDQDKAAMVFYPTPGLSNPLDLGFSGGGGIEPDQPCRGARTIGNTTYTVFGQVFVGFGVTTFQTSSVKLTTSKGRVSMTDNGSQILLVDGEFGYTFDIAADGSPVSGDITKITAPGFPTNPTVCDFINGFFLVDAPNAGRPGQFQWSGLYSGTSWSALDFANAESSPDALVQIKVKAGQIYLFGRDSYEVWSPSGDAAVFRRVGGTGAEWGIAAKWSLVDFGDNTLALLAQNILGQFVPVKVVGYNVVQIGGPDPEIANSMNQMSAGSATAYSYSLDAHSFYQVNFANKSYLYDSLSDAWSIVSSDGGRHFGEIRAALYSGIDTTKGLSLVFDYRKPTAYVQDIYAFTDSGTPIIRTIVSKHVFSDYERVSINELYIDCEVGTADVPASGVPPRAPQIMLEWSKDGGRTYGNQIFQSLGNIGQYQTRARWQNLGIARDWVFRFSFSDANRIVITNAAVRVS